MVRKTSGNPASGAGISPGSLVVDPGATGTIVQLRAGLRGPLTWSKLSGASAVAVAGSGVLSLSAALGAGGAAAAVVRVANGAGDAIERSLALSASTGTAPPLGSLPQTGFLVARWSADAIPPQADDSALTGWTDSVGGLVAAQATTAAQPRYRTGGAGGKPYVLFSGAQCLDAGSSNAVATACQNAANAGNTVMVLYRNVQATGFGFLFTASASTGFNLFANTTQAGLYGGPGQRVNLAGSGLTTLCYTGGAPEAGLSRLYINNTCLGHAAIVKSAAGASVGIGSSPANIAGLGVKAEIYEVIVWNKALTAAEVMQAEKWLRDKHAAAYPWASAPFRVFHGDSLTVGQASSSGFLNTYPARVAAINGWPMGSWTNLGHGGIGMVAMKGEAIADIDPMMPLLGATPMHLAAWEWFNQRGLAVADAQAATTSYFQARRTAGVAKLVMLTSTDATDTAETATERTRRAQYNAYLDANWATYADAYVPIHTDAGIGVEGACPNTAPYTPNFSTDGIHMLDAGYNVLAGLVAPAMAGL